MSNVPPDFGRTPRALLESNLGLHANAVFQALAYHDKAGTEFVHPSLATIATVADLSINSVRKALQRLAGSGWIEIHDQRKGWVKIATYRLNYGALTVSPGNTANPQEEPVLTVSPDDMTVSPGDTENAPAPVSKSTAHRIKNEASRYRAVISNKKKNNNKEKEAGADAPAFALTPPSAEKSKTQTFVLPDWVPADKWAAWEEMRKAKRVPTTNAARQLAVNEIEKLRASGQDPGTLLDQSTLKGWAGIHPVSGSNGNGASAKPKRQYLND